MDEFIIFERTFVRMNQADNLFVRFSCAEDNELQFVRATNVVFKESFGLMTPTLAVTFMDGSGDFINNNRLNTEAIFTLHFGRDLYNSYKAEYKIAHINAGNGISGQSKSTHFQVLFVHRAWEEVTAEKRNRGWSNVRYSDVVNTIAREGGYKTIEVEPSSGVRETIIQSNVTNRDMMRYLKRDASPRSGDGHYEYSGRIDNVFFFKSTSQLISEGIAKFRAGTMPVLRLGGQPSVENRDELYAQNENVPISFTDFSINEKYMKSVIDGGSAIESGYYDWNSRQYIRSVHRFQDLNVTQLSEWSLLRDNVDFVSEKVDGGRDPVVQSKANNKLSVIAHDVQEIHVNIEGQYTLHCGDIVEVIIPNALGDSESPYNEMYSGFYMISQVTHQMMLMSSSDYVSQLVLVRHGLDGKNMKGYRRSSKGRARFSK